MGKEAYVLVVCRHIGPQIFGRYLHRRLRRQTLPNGWPVSNDAGSRHTHLTLTGTLEMVDTAGVEPASLLVTVTPRHA